MKVKLAIAILFHFGAIIKANENNSAVGINGDFDFLNDYIKLDKLLRQFADRGVKRMLPFALRVAENVNISSTCQDNLFQLMNGIRKLTEWSINYLDAMGKPQSGILLGNLQMYGEQRQCFDTVVKKKDKIEFRGQYCGIAVKPIMPYKEKLHAKYKFQQLQSLTKNSSGLLKIIIDRLSATAIINPKLGMCLPSGCTEDDISKLFKYFSEQVYYVNATVAYCVKKEDLVYWTSERIIAACVFAFLGIILVTGTIVDFFVEENANNKLATRILQCFSVTRNFPKLMNTDTSEEAITCFYGIRVLSIFWIVLCHEYLMQGSALVANHALDLLQFIKGFFSQIVLNGFTATEIFFFLGGFVNCYTRAKIKQSGKPQPSVLKIIIHRLWRIYPTLMITYLVFILLSTAVPQFHVDQKLAMDICRKQFWKNVLFINNYFHMLGSCLSHTWYVSVDMQMFLSSLITIPILLRNEKLGLYLNSGIIILANIGSFFLWWIRNLPPSPVNIELLNKSLVDEATEIYLNPILHIASYYIGILIGYLVATKKEKKFSKINLALGWLTASFFYIFVLFLTYRWNSGIPYTKFESSLYGSFSKSILILSIAWMVYCCKIGQGGVVNYILSLKLWIPLSRLTYMMYMVSIIIQIFFNFNINYPGDFASIYLIWSYFGNLSISLLLSFALVLLVESPFLALEKILFRRDQNEKPSSSEFQKDVTMNIKAEIAMEENPTFKTINI